MKFKIAAILYSLALVFANAASAAETGRAELEALREGDMRKLVIHAEPAPVPDLAVETIDGEPVSLADYRGRWLLVNFWATWCVPCRDEMPSLSALQEARGGDEFTVVTIAAGRNPPEVIKAFFDALGIDDLPGHRDPRMQLARKMRVLGLPVSLIVDPEGREVARMIGDADWAGPEAQAMLDALMAGSG